MTQPSRQAFAMKLLQTTCALGIAAALALEAQAAYHEDGMFRYYSDGDGITVEGSAGVDCPDSGHSHSILLVRGDIRIPTEFTCTCNGHIHLESATPTKIASAAFMNFNGDYREPECHIRHAITSAYIPDTIREIRDFVFYGCHQLKSVRLPESISSMDTDSFFNGCRSLGAVKLPKGTEFAGVNMCLGCTSLTSVELPVTVTAIRNNAFDGCTALPRLNLPKALETISFEAFRNCSSLEEIILPDAVTTIKARAFEGCSNLKEVQFGTGLTHLSEDLFKGCVLLTSVSIPDNVLTYGTTPFADSPNIRSVRYPGSDGSTSSQMSNLFPAAYEQITNIVIGSQREKTVAKQFAGCRNLRSFDIPMTIATIGDRTFENCAAMEEIVLPASVTKIGRFLFDGCTNLTSITFRGDMPSASNKAQAFGNVAPGCVVRVPRGAPGWAADGKRWTELPIVEYDLTSYDVRYDPAEGQGVMSRQTCETDRVYALAPCAFTHSTKSFAGWLGSNGKRYDDGVMIFNAVEAGGVLTLTAIWE